MYSNSSRTPCVPWIVSTHITGHVWTTCVLCDRQVATSHMLTATEKQHGPIPSCGLKMLVVQNCNMGCNMGFTWNSQKSQPMHTPTLPCSRVEMPSNGRCLAWWQEECKVFGLGGQGRQKGKKKGKKKSVPTSICEGFQSLPSGQSTSRWVSGYERQEVANACQAATKELL